jgi:hypothetical protein
LLKNSVQKVKFFLHTFPHMGSNLNHPGLKENFQCDLVGLSAGEGRNAIAAVIAAGLRRDASLMIEEVVKIAVS